MRAAVVVQAMVKPDGTLELPDNVVLPPGPVQVIVQPLPELPRADPFWQRMQALWDAQKAQGHVPRAVEEVERERRPVRDEWEERLRRHERLPQEEQTPGGASEPRA